METENLLEPALSTEATKLIDLLRNRHGTSSEIVLLNEVCQVLLKHLDRQVLVEVGEDARRDMDRIYRYF